MNIQQHLGKIKALTHFLDKRDTYTAFILVFSGLGSFFLGKASVIREEIKPVTILEAQECPSIPIIESTPKEPVEERSEGKPEGKKAYVGSKTGSKYHLPDCPGAKMISEANKIWFSSKSEAEKAGYSPAGNCKGI